MRGDHCLQSSGARHGTSHGLGSLLMGITGARQVGGVLFAMEMSTRWRKELTWRAFMACAITVVVVRLLNIMCVQHQMCSMLQWGSLIWFSVSDTFWPTRQTPHKQQGRFCCR